MSKEIKIVYTGEDLENGKFHIGNIMIQPTPVNTNLSEAIIVLLVAYRSAATLFVTNHPKECPDCDAMKQHRSALAALATAENLQGL